MALIIEPGSQLGVCTMPAGKLCFEAFDYTHSCSTPILKLDVPICA